MEEDNLPSGKSDWLLIKALCFVCWIEGPLYYSNMYLNKTLRMKDKHIRIKEKIQLFLMCEYPSREGRKKEGSHIYSLQMCSTSLRWYSLPTNNATVCFNRFVNQKNTCLTLGSYAWSLNTLSPMENMFHYHIHSWKEIPSWVSHVKKICAVGCVSSQRTIQVCLTLVLLGWHNRKANISLSCASRRLSPPTLERWQAYTRTSIIIQHSKNASRRIITETWRARANPKYFTLYDCLARLSLRLTLTLTKCNVGLSESQ